MRYAVQYPFRDEARLRPRLGLILPTSVIPTILGESPFSLRKQEPPRLRPWIRRWPAGAPPPHPPTRRTIAPQTSLVPPTAKAAVKGPPKDRGRIRPHRLGIQTGIGAIEAYFAESEPECAVPSRSSLTAESVGRLRSGLRVPVASYPKALVAPILVQARVRPDSSATPPFGRRARFPHPPRRHQEGARLSCPRHTPGGGAASAGGARGGAAGGREAGGGEAGGRGVAHSRALLCLAAILLDASGAHRRAARREMCTRPPPGSFLPRCRRSLAQTSAVGCDAAWLMRCGLRGGAGGCAMGCCSYTTSQGTAMQVAAGMGGTG